MTRSDFSRQPVCFFRRVAGGWWRAGGPALLLAVSGLAMGGLAMGQQPANPEPAPEAPPAKEPPAALPTNRAPVPGVAPVPARNPRAAGARINTRPGVPFQPAVPEGAPDAEPTTDTPEDSDGSVFDRFEAEARREAAQAAAQAGAQAGQPGAAAAGGAGEGAANAPVDLGDSVSFESYSEPVELSAIVELAAELLSINVVIPQNGVPGTVVFNAPVQVPKSRLLDLVDALLEQQDHTITFDETSGFYIITQIANREITFGERATTKIIELANIKPSTLQNALQQIVGPAGGGGGGVPGTVSFIDELGLVVVTDTPRQIARVEEFISQLVLRASEFALTPIPVKYLSASVARDRMLALVGEAGASGGVAVPNTQRLQNRRNVQQPQGEGQVAIGAPAGSSLDNLAERLAIDPQGNTLLFRGTADELPRVRGLLASVDKPNELTPRKHFVGGATRQVAEFARQRGLGEVIEFEDAQTQGFGLGNQQQININAFDGAAAAVGGPVMVIDTQNGEIIYYGTPAQQEQLEELVQELDVERDRVVIRSYKLNNAEAEDIASIIGSLLSGQQQLGTGALLPGARGQTGFQPLSTFRDGGRRQGDGDAAADAGGGGGGGVAGDIGDIDPQQTFVVADAANNQIVVKAPFAQQEDFAKLIRQLDLRRPQVYLETLIVLVSDSETLRFALETQFNIGDFQTRTNFGLSSIADGGGFGSRPNVATGLQGLTAALVQSDRLPFVLTALQNDVKTRIISAPQVLVNDNEEATVATAEQQPTTAVQTGQTTDITSFNGFEAAETRLTVTPRISQAGFLGLEVELLFQNFVGTGGGGVPPPREDREVNTDVTVPTDSTIIVGGITVENVQNTVIKVPLLGDIPLLGQLFRDTNTVNDKSVLYFFITPRILTDPSFQDLKLLSRGPYADTDLDDTVPDLRPERIEAMRRVTTPRPAAWNTASAPLAARMGAGDGVGGPGVSGPALVGSAGGRDVPAGPASPVRNAPGGVPRPAALPGERPRLEPIPLTVTTRRVDEGAEGASDDAAAAPEAAPALAPERIGATGASGR